MKFIKVNKLNEGLFNTKAQMQAKLAKERETSDEDLVSSMARDTIIKNIKEGVRTLMQSYNINPLMGVDVDGAKRDPISIMDVEYEVHTADVEISSLSTFGKEEVEGEQDEITVNFHFPGTSITDETFIYVDGGYGKYKWPGAKEYASNKHDYPWTIPAKEIKESFATRLSLYAEIELKKPERGKARKTKISESVLNFIKNAKIKLGYIGLCNNEGPVKLTASHDFPFIDILYHKEETVTQFIGFLNSFNDLFVFENSGSVEFLVPEARISNYRYVSALYNKTEEEKILEIKGNKVLGDILRRTISPEYLDTHDAKTYYDKELVPGRNVKVFKEYLETVKKWDEYDKIRNKHDDLLFSIMGKLHISELEVAYQERLKFSFDKGSKKWELSGIANNYATVQFITSRSHDTIMNIRMSTPATVDWDTPYKDRITKVEIYMPFIQFLKALKGKYTKFYSEDGQVPNYLTLLVMQNGSEQEGFIGMADEIKDFIITALYPENNREIFNI